jgi:DNA-binding PadR family transcriptional regulator
MAEPSTIYKLAILSLLSHSKEPLSNAVISDFFLEKDYTDFFNVQQALSALEEAALVERKSAHNRQMYSILPAGEETLRYLSGKLNQDVISDIQDFLDRNHVSIDEENEIRSDWFQDLAQNYYVHLVYRKKGQTVIDLTLTVPGKEAAEAVCLNWHKYKEPLQETLYDLLIK